MDSSYAHEARVPTVSLTRATIFTSTPIFLHALSNRSVTFSPTTPEVLKPFAHRVNVPFLKLLCFTGKEKVNPTTSPLPETKTV